MNITHRLQLPELMRHLNLPMTACECGVAEGYNSADLLRLGVEKLYMIDAWATLENATGDGTYDTLWHDKNYDAAMIRIIPFKEKAIVLRGRTLEMAAQIPDKSLGLVYLDAGHDYRSVLDDLYYYFPKLVHGGIMAGHDFFNYDGLKKAVVDFCRGRFDINVLPEDKEEDAGFYFIKKLVS